MLKFLKFTRPFDASYNFHNVQVIMDVNLRNRAYSSHPLLKSIRLSRMEENEILGPLLLFVKARKFDDLFGSLNDSASLNAQIFDRLIKASWRIPIKQEIELKENVLDIMRKLGVKPVASSLNAMIPLYSEVGDTSKLDALLEIMIEKGIKRNVSTYTYLMKCHENDTSRIDELYLQMKKDGIRPNLSTYTLMIKACSEDLDKVDDLFTRMKEDGIKPDVYIYATMIKAFSRDLDKVEKLCLEMIKQKIKHNAFTHNSMINAYAKNGQMGKAIELFNSKELEGMNPDVVTYTSMIDAYAKNGQMGKAIELFNSKEMEGMKPDVAAYNSMIDAYAKSGQIVKAIDLFTSMKIKGLKPTVISYSMMIDVYAKSGQIDKAIEVFTSMEIKGMKPGVFTYSTMINAYAKSGQMSKAIELFTLAEMGGLKPNLFIYTSMIDAYAKNAQMDEAIELFNSKKMEGMKPDVAAYNSMIDAYSKDGQEDKAREMFASMKREGLKPNVNTFSTVLDCYVKNGERQDDMICILKEMKESSVVLDTQAWNIIMDGFSRVDGERDHKKALSIWKYISGQQSYDSLGIPDLPLKTLSVYPDAVTLCIAIDLCKKGDFEKEAHEIWNFGQENDRIVLDPNVLTSYVEYLSFLGETGADLVVVLIKRGIKGDNMPRRCVRPDKKTLANAKECLKSNGWKNHVSELDSVIL
jgi:pentatricopeptide repeat protein